MSIENAIRKRTALLERVGKSALNMMYPKDFELYVVALELIDAELNTLQYFSFPVNPSSIDESNQRMVSVTKTFAGVVSLRNAGFVPSDITLSGTFGRKFRVLLGTDYVSFLHSFTVNNSNKITQDSAEKGIKEFFDERVKTGYGCLNVLKDIIKQSDVIDSKGPRMLIWHNLAFGTTYIVEPMSFRTQMSQESNMLHNYTLQMKAVAPYNSLINGIKELDNREKLATTAYAQSQTDRLLQGLTKLF